MKDIFARRSAVAIVAKRPVPGNVKTRLCPPLSFSEAARLYACFLWDTINKVESVPGVLKYVALDGGEMELNGVSLPSSFSVIQQGSGNLGDRLNHITGVLFKNVDRLLFLGADSPNLPYLYIEQALQALSNHDVVIGPSDDGGYYLLGLSDHFAYLFEEIDWSTSLVFEQTMRRVRAAKLRVKVISTWYDVDTHDDLLKLINDLQDNLTAAPTTAAFLKSIRR